MVSPSSIAFPISNISVLPICTEDLHRNSCRFNDVEVYILSMFARYTIAVYGYTHMTMIAIIIAACQLYIAL